jgi:hypothetical protein
MLKRNTDHPELSFRLRITNALFTRILSTLNCFEKCHLCNVLLIYNIAFMIVSIKPNEDVDTPYRDQQVCPDIILCHVSDITDICSISQMCNRRPWLHHHSPIKCYRYTSVLSLWTLLSIGLILVVARMSIKVNHITDSSSQVMMWVSSLYLTAAVTTTKLEFDIILLVTIWAILLKLPPAALWTLIQRR